MTQRINNISLYRKVQYRIHYLHRRTTDCFIHLKEYTKHNLIKTAIIMASQNVTEFRVNSVWGRSRGVLYNLFGFLSSSIKVKSCVMFGTQQIIMHSKHHDWKLYQQSNIRLNWNLNITQNNVYTSYNTRWRDVGKIWMKRKCVAKI